MGKVVRGKSGHHFRFNLANLSASPPNRRPCPVHTRALDHRYVTHACCCSDARARAPQTRLEYPWSVNSCESQGLRVGRDSSGRVASHPLYPQSASRTSRKPASPLFVSFALAVGVAGLLLALASTASAEPAGAAPHEGVAPDDLYKMSKWLGYKATAPAPAPRKPAADAPPPKRDDTPTLW